MKLSPTVISRCRLAKSLSEGLAWGEARKLAASLGIHEARVGRALRRPDEFLADFEHIASDAGYQRAAQDGFYRKLENV